MAVINGTNLLLKAITSGGALAAVGHTTSASLSLSLDMPEATTKESSGFAEYIAGVRSAEISFEGLVDHSDAAGSDVMSGYLTGRTKIDWSFSTGTSGDEIYSGSGFVSSCEITSDMEAPVSYSGTITVTGTITQGQN